MLRISFFRRLRTTHHAHSQTRFTMTYLAAAYGVIWLVVFILVFSMRRRQEKVVEQLETLEEIINEKQ